jgi:hypothetical protein
MPGAIAVVTLDPAMLLSRRRTLAAVAVFLLLIAHQSSAQNRPDNARITPVVPIIVQQSIFDSPDEGKIVSAVVDFVNILSDEGAYLHSEIPANAIRAYLVDYYLAQVSNGGHAQFIHNSRLREGELRHIREGLAALKLDPFIEIFRDFEAEVMRDIARAREHGIANHKALDTRFFKLDAYKTLLPANETKPVPDADYRRAMNALVTANPQRTARLAERARATIKYRLTQPLFTAAALVAARMNLRTSSLGAGIYETNPDGKQQMGWSISSPSGRGLMFLDDKEVIYTESYLDDGRRFTDELAKERRDALFAKSPDIARLMKQKIVNREALRIPMSEVTAAIDAAGRLPVVEAAALALSRLTAGKETLEFVLPLGRQGAEGTWLWRTQSATKSFEISFVGDTILVFQNAKRPILTLKRAELDAYIAAQARGPG